MKVRAVPIFSIVRLEAEDSASRGKRGDLEAPRVQ